MSDGCCQIVPNYGTHWVQVNGQIIPNLPLSRGYNIVALDPETGNVLHKGVGVLNGIYNIFGQTLTMRQNFRSDEI